MMLNNEDQFTKEEAGRVIDLRKMIKPEIKPEIAPVKKDKGGLFIIKRVSEMICPWRNHSRANKDKKPLIKRVSGIIPRYKVKKGHKVDFLKLYKKLEKKEDSLEREFLKEYLEDDEPKKKRNILVSFFNFIIRVFSLWWLPLFIIRFIWILFWRIFKFVFFRKNKKRSLAVFAGQKIGQNKAPGENFKVFWQALWALPREVKNFLLGRTTEDYLQQRVLFEEVTKKKFRPFKHIFSFIFLLALFILPFGFLNFYNVAGIKINDLRGRVLGVSQRAIGDLQFAAASVSNLDLKQASENFGAAKESFQEANNNLSAVSDILFQLGKVIPNDKIRLAAESREITSAGVAASSLGNNLTLAIESFFSIDSQSLSAKIDNFINYESLALADARKLNEEIAKINIDVIPAEYRDQFTSLKQKGADLEDVLSDNIELVKKINIFLGSDSDKRYLFVFQNNSEMRATGGFIGSYSLVDFSQGKIKNIEVPGGGSYDTSGGLTTLVVAPEPLYLVNPLWHFWDANWWPDWQKSAQKLAWFYEKSGGPTTDGVIAFTPTVLERILNVIGPIDMTATHGVVMTGDNLWENLRTIIEQEKKADAKLPYALAENKPKKIIGELMQAIITEIPARLDREKFIQLLSGLETDLSEKQILFYFNDFNLQSEVENRNWAGRIKETNKDYLMVVNTNIAGGKSDRKIEETISHQADVQTDGSIIDTVTIARIHTGVRGDLFSGMRNVNWMRIYVPEGSELLEAAGFRGPDPIYFSLPEAGWLTDPDVAAEEGNNAIIDREHLNTKIYTEEGKTVFANWSMIDPGETGIITLKYKLPFKLEKKPVEVVKKQGLDALIDKMIKTENKDLFVYSLFIQKQPGSMFTSINSNLYLPANFKINWNYPADLSVNSQSWQLGEKLDSDKYWAVVIEKNSLTGNETVNK